VEHRLSAAAIEEAARLIDPVFLSSRHFRSEEVNAYLGCEMTLKDETANPIRSFKGRGADYFLTKVTERGDHRQLVCASTGNFGQAMAYACRKHDRPLVVFADELANPVKVGRIAEMGAELRLEGADFDAAKALAREFCERTDSWMVEDGHEPEISEGAGTIALELLERDDFDAMLIPLGNGALLNGNARWIEETAPDTEVIGVSAAGADAMARSWREGDIVVKDKVDTISEGIAVRVPVPSAVADMAGLVDDVVLVDDDTTVEAMRLLHRHTGLAVEPAAAVGIAAVVGDRSRFEGKKVATILTGANLTEEQRRLWLG
jgi:threonine dehydratase